MSDSLQSILIRQIQQDGPISVADYMTQCLTHPEFGYYMGRDPFGRGGDFTTAPEVSQMFGEMVGAWLLHEWDKQGRPTSFTLLELGPGRGTLMADILRVACKVPGFIDAAHVTLIEVSPVLRDKQRQALQGFEVSWCEALHKVRDDLPLFVVANEFFDALPLDQYQFTGGFWKRRCVSSKNEALAFDVFGETVDVDVPRGMVPSEGDVLEIAPAHASYFETLCVHIAAQGGAGLVIDYGYFSPTFGESLQAIKDSRFADVLCAPGHADLTVHVNFHALAQVAQEQGLDFVLGTQGAFLQRCGIDYRAQALSQIAKGQQRNDIEQALHRLINSDEMGDLFKVIEFSKAVKT